MYGDETHPDASWITNSYVPSTTFIGLVVKAWKLSEATECGLPLNTSLQDAHCSSQNEHLPLWNRKMVNSSCSLTFFSGSLDQKDSDSL